MMRAPTLVARVVGLAALTACLAHCGSGVATEEDAGTIEVDANVPVDGGPPAEREPATELGDDGQEVWVFMQSHLHTTGYHACANAPLDPGTGAESACYASAGISGFLQDALAHDASDMIITDHNNIDAWFDPAFAPLANFERTRFATPLRGTEWSSMDGHMTLLFPTQVVDDNLAAITNGWVFGAGNQTPVSSFEDYRNAITSVHAAGGIVMINHPELSIHSFPEDSMGADGVEVGIPPNPLDDRNGGSVSAHSSAEARRFWQRRLIAGDRLTGTAGADHHHGGGDIPGLEAPTFGIAVNMIRIDPGLPDADVAEALSAPAQTIDRRTAIVIDAVRRGHVMVVEDVASARVFVGADTDGDGRFHDARAGDCVLPGSISSAEMRVRVRITAPSTATGSSHYNLELWDQTSDSAPSLLVEVDYATGFAPNAAYEIDPSDPFAIELTLPYDASDRRFVRFVLVRDVVGPIDDTEVVTNPIYYGDWGSECGESSPLY
ncbi:MAG: hypothetical protein M3Y87_08950 [Myxococcota bacterium]|nr:hypothetical protein [Myxococcota bacterium]